MEIVQYLPNENISRVEKSLCKRYREKKLPNTSNISYHNLSHSGSIATKHIVSRILAPPNEGIYFETTKRNEL